ncbi:ATP-binding protein [Acuticoccus sediminis]|uniref:ATP-binding protein n=1 Tax=Acuticoccus sediminis TaxID=2184697 RepID=UPI0021F5B536|nr:helix-turn-helix transcriptional regulator [Acuticoccus sediminis]
MISPVAAGSGHVAFGPFRLSAAERLLTRDGAPVELGGRTLDLLIALVAQPNVVIGKRELLASVWPDVTVEETSLRFHMAVLRKALGDGRAGARYIATLAGRGYCFVAPVGRSEARPATGPRSAAPASNLPSRLTRVVGREADILAVSDALLASRLVSIVGPGGVGKTTVAVGVGQALCGRFDDGVLFVDLALVARTGAAEEGDAVEGTVAAIVASAFGLPAQPQDPATTLVACLAEKRLLVVLDTCEHLVADVARLAARLVAAAPDVHVLATSREALRVAGEHVYRLDPLGCPPVAPDVSFAAVRSCPAVELFLDRAAAGGMRIDLSDADAAHVVRICHKLDGVPLALEMAAGRVAAYGLAETADLIDRHFALVIEGQRTASPRQRTLQATLDWSYTLLTACERTVLRRLAVFVGDFSLDGALAVAATEHADHAGLFGVIDSLVAKSMVATRLNGAAVRYRLLDTTRAYVQANALDEAEACALAARHAGYYRRALGSDAVWHPAASVDERACYLAIVSNVKAALAWCFGDGGDRRLGAELAGVAASGFLVLSMFGDAHRWATAALAALDEDMRGGRTEMLLRHALGVSLTFAGGRGDAACDALDRSYAIACADGTPGERVWLLGPLLMQHMRMGEFDAGLRDAEACTAIAQAMDDPDAEIFAHALLGVAAHYAGDLKRAQAAFAALQGRSSRYAWPVSYLGLDSGVPAAFLARTLWLRGDAEEALRQAEAAILDAERTVHPLSRSVTLMWAATVMIWHGDIAASERVVDRLEAAAATHGLVTHQAVARGLRGEIDLMRGDTDAAIARLAAAIEALRGRGYALQTTPMSIALVRALTAAGRLPDAIALADETICSVTRAGDRLYLAAALRAKAGALAAGPSAYREEAKRCLVEALEHAVPQGAAAWALHAATDLLTLAATPADADGARSRLQEVVDSYPAGARSPDLIAARRRLIQVTAPANARFSA